MAELITGYLQKNGIIEQEKQEVYIYGLQQMGVEMINILSIFLISIVCGQLVEAENKPLDQMEIRIYRKKAKQIWCMETICFLVSILGKWVPVYESILLAGICTSLSLVAANVKKLKVRK
ncbi:MAG: accessory gene regulator B family protein [Lachnospiraceae bacterium]|nr:accessory gene regulator B family protein [Lachnospiraceae bacterium]